MFIKKRKLKSYYKPRHCIQNLVHQSGLSEDFKLFLNKSMKSGVWTWCMKISKKVKNLLVAVDIFSRFVRVKTMKTKYAKDNLQAFRKMISRKNTPEKLWVDKGTESGGTFKNFCKEKDIEVYSTMSETKAAFAERESNSVFKTYNILLH